MKKIITVIVVLLVLSGCASGPKSKALQISEAAGIGKNLYDSPRAKIERAGVKVSNVGANAKTIADLGVALGGATGHLLFGGIGGLGNVALGLGSILTKTTDPKDYSRILFWMPVDQAVVDEGPISNSLVDRFQHSKKLTENVNQFVIPAIERALPPGWKHIIKEAVVDDRHRESIWTRTIKKAVNGEYKITSVTFDMHYLRNEEHGLDVFIAGGVGGNQQIGNAPDVLDLSGERMSYEGGRGLWFAVSHKKSWNKYNKLPGLNILKFYQKVSENLPDWAYVYAAPLDGVNSIPLMFHKGKLMLFMKPSDEKKLKTAMKE